VRQEADRLLRRCTTKEELHPACFFLPRRRFFFFFSEAHKNSRSPLLRARLEVYGSFSSLLREERSRKRVPLILLLEEIDFLTDPMPLGQFVRNAETEDQFP